MGFFGDLGLAYEFAIILGGLICLTFAAAFAKLFWMKRKVAKAEVKHDIEAAEKATQKATMKQPAMGEGDLFGVRAIEKGFYGGVAQSAPNSAPNSPPLSPFTIVDGDGIPIPGSSMRGSSLSQSASHTSLRGSKRSLRLQPSDAELSGRRNHDLGAALSIYTPTSPVRSESSARSLAHSEPSTLPSIPPVYQVKSYAQWRLSNTRGTSRSRGRSESRVRSEIGCTSDRSTSPDSYRDPRTGRRKSRSVSVADVENNHWSVDQANRNQTSIPSSYLPRTLLRSTSDYGFSSKVVSEKLLQGPPSSRVMSIGSTPRSRRRSRSQISEFGLHRHSSAASTRSLRRTRDSVHQNQEVLLNNMAASVDPSSAAAS